MVRIKKQTENTVWIVALAWLYVVGLMALTEPSLVAGLMTFLVYCALPLSLLFYITGAKRRRERRRLAALPPPADDQS
jgi:hypothetical protein